MITLLELEGRRKLQLDGDTITREEALEIAERLVNTFGVCGPKIRAKVVYEVKSDHYQECPHADTLADAMKETEA